MLGNWMVRHVYPIRCALGYYCLLRAYKISTSEKHKEMFGIEIYMCLYIIYMGPFIHRPVLHLSVSAVPYKVPCIVPLPALIQACLDAIQILSFFTLSLSHQFLAACMKY